MIKTTPFNPVDYLDNDEVIGAFVLDALKTGDPSFIAHAIEIAEQAKGMHGQTNTSPIEQFFTLMNTLNIKLQPSIA